MNTSTAIESDDPDWVLRQAIFTYLGAAGHVGKWHGIRDLFHLEFIPTHTVELVSFAHELDDADTPGPSWRFGHDVTGAAEINRAAGRTEVEVDWRRVADAFIALASAGSLERRRGPYGNTEYRRAPHHTQTS